MSVSKWGYEPWKCEGEFCPGDCDVCYKGEWQRDDEDLEDDVEQDGWKTWMPKDSGETDANVQDHSDSE